MDAAKDARNVAEHGISFAQAIAMFDGPVLTRSDHRYDYGERRDLSLGQLQRVAVIAVVHTDRDGGRRIISARRANRREGQAMKPRFDREMSPEDLAALPDETIDYSDIPELDDDFFRDARLVEPDITRSVTLRIKTSVLDAFKADGKGVSDPHERGSRNLCSEPARR